MSDSVRPHRRQPTRLPHPWILQARTLEWVAISFSNAGKWKVKVKSLSRVRLLATPWTVAFQAPLSMGFSRQEYWSGVPLPSPGHCLFHFVGLQCSSCASVSPVKLAAEKYNELNQTQKDHKLLHQLPSSWQFIDYSWILKCFAGQLHFSVALKCLWEDLKQVDVFGPEPEFQTYVIECKPTYSFMRISVKLSGIWGCILSSFFLKEDIFWWWCFPYIYFLLWAASTPCYL